MFITVNTFVTCTKKNLLNKSFCTWKIKSSLIIFNSLKRLFEIIYDNQVTLRDGAVPLPDTRRELQELLAEAKYYCIEELSSECENLIGTTGDSRSDVIPICRVPLITSPREEQALISANNMKPVVKLLINRHNNKYSYTGASDDNLLKNIELFDKLSLRFSNRVLFIKDVIGKYLYL